MTITMKQFQANLRPSYKTEEWELSILKMLPNFETNICRVGDQVRVVPSPVYTVERKAAIHTVLQVLIHEGSGEVGYKISGPFPDDAQYNLPTPAVSRWVNGELYLSVEEYEELKRLASKKLAARK